MAALLALVLRMILSGTMLLTAVSATVVAGLLIAALLLTRPGLPAAPRGGHRADLDRR